jgi:hypothetical protein
MTGVTNVRWGYKPVYPVNQIYGKKRYKDRAQVIQFEII